MKKYSFDDDNCQNDKLSDKDSFASLEEATIFLRRGLHNCLDYYHPTIEQGEIVIPKWNIRIYPQVKEMNDRVVTADYYISCSEWDEPLYECSTGLAQTQKDALGMSQGSFTFGILDTVFNMMNSQDARELETEFVGNRHSWKVYIGNIVGMGQTPQDSGADVYWNALRDEIVKRLGDRKLCYVKIYGANDGNGSITGECRINDIKSNELSDLVADMVSKWNNTSFGSQKQFFMIKQDAETYIHHPFTIRQIMDKTELAMKLFESCETDEQYEKFSENLLNVTDGDSNLAWELYAFIPEICAYNAFTKLKLPETIMMNINGETQTYYMNQIYSYFPILNGVFRCLNRGVLKNSNKTYQDYISVSSVYSVICSARENGADIEVNGGEITTIYNPYDNYIVR